MPLQIRFNHVLQLKKQPFNSGARTFRQVGRALRSYTSMGWSVAISITRNHSKLLREHGVCQNPAFSLVSPLSQSVARSPLFVLHIPADSNCPLLSSSFIRCLRHAQTFVSVLPEMQKSSSMLFVLGYSLWSCNVLEVRSAWPYVLAAYTSGKSEAEVFPSLWNRASSALQREGVGVLQGIVRLMVYATTLN